MSLKKIQKSLRFVQGSYMVSVQHPKPLGLKQESTDYDVAASELSYSLCSIIDAASLSSKEERGGNED